MSTRGQDITSVIRQQIEQFGTAVTMVDVGTVIEVGDGIARIHGLAGARYNELLEFPNGVIGIALNLEEDRERLKDRLEAVTDREIVLSAEVDPEIIGGIVARLGDRLIDGSTRSKLKALRRSLVEAGPT